MTPDEIRQALHSNRPFRVRTSDGKVVDVPHQDFAALSPDGRTFVVMQDRGKEVMDVPLITAIELPLPPAAA
jgi:hypothetical protein